MDGIETITAKILDDARQQIADINNQTRQQVEQLEQQYARRAKQEADAILEEGRTAARERQERLVSSAGQERRKMELEAKQQVLDEAFALALDKLCSLPEEDYVSVLAAMAVRAARSGREQLVFSQTDRARVGKRVVMAANEALPGGAGQMTLSEETRPMRGGFVVCDGRVETNCSFEMLVRMQREKMERQAADILFG